MSYFSSINIAVSALRAQQYAMSVTGHNIANANTEGYRRQEPVFIAGDPLIAGAGIPTVGAPKVGTGVQVETVQRAQTDFIDGQIRSSTQSLGLWNSKNESLQQVESFLSEPSDSGLSSTLNEFWNAWEDLAATPESQAPRAAVVNSGTTLADQIKKLHSDLVDVQTQANDTINTSVDDINRISHEIAKINSQIRSTSDGNFVTNDLLDRRDLLVEQLSQYAQIETHGDSGADMIVSIGGKALVQGDHAAELTTDIGTEGKTAVKWADDGSDVNFTGGSMNGLLDIRDNVVQGYITSLNSITQAIITNTNEIHSSGKGLDGRVGDFFTGTDASNISVADDLIAKPSSVAASESGTSGDNTIAVQISNLRDSKVFGSETISDKYDAMVSSIASDADEAKLRSGTQDLSLKQLKTQRESVAGVSLDEEMANMIKFQQAYNASARILTTINEMIDTVVNRMGVG